MSVTKPERRAPLRLWIQGLRPKSLPAAIAPVLAGTGAAAFAGREHWGIAGLCLLVALFLQIGVNFANDYSDGVRGADDDARVGPERLVGPGHAKPSTVKAVAFAFFGLACLAGVGIVVLTAQWWLIAVGIVCVLAAWYYTGGKHPYGYYGLGELMVFVFFGLVAVCGTTFVQARAVTWPSLVAAVVVGALASAILVTDNLRDIASDTAVGKRTLATYLGHDRTRTLFVALHVVAACGVVALALLATPWAALGFAGAPLAWRACKSVTSGADGMALLPVMKWTGLAELVCGAGLFAGLLIGR